MSAPEDVGERGRLAAAGGAPRGRAGGVGPLLGTLVVLVLLVVVAAVLAPRAAQLVREAGGPHPLRSVTAEAAAGMSLATLRGSAADEFEPLPYRSSGGGRIEPDQGWVERHIVTAEVPLLEGPVRCHRVLVPQLRGALGELEQRGLGHLIDPDQYGGCWVPRHILFDPGRALSLHAWGLAVDLNVGANPYGQEPALDPRVVDVFERWGFAWGGHWRVPDGMHFELVEVVDAPGP